MEHQSELFFALAKAQGEIKPVAPDSTNPSYGGSFASLAALREACREPMAKNGLSITHLPSLERKEDGPWVVVRTILAHASGETLTNTIEGRPYRAGTFELSDDLDTQAMTTTRLIRMQLKAMLGLTQKGEEDSIAKSNHLIGMQLEAMHGLTQEDGIAKSEGADTQGATIERITPSQVGELQRLIALGDVEIGGFLAWAQAGKLEDIQASQLEHCVKALQAKIDAKVES